MITTKQRAYLRSVANETEPVLQIGKAGLTDALLKTLDDALEAREIVKLSVLETAPLAPKECMERIISALGCEAVQVIGRKVTVYRESKKEEKKKIVLPR